MADTSDIVIVGAGPAGLTAALALADAGVRSSLIDDNDTAGGQIFRTGARERGYPGKDPRGARLRAALLAQRGLIDYRPRSEVVGIEPDLALWVHGSGGAVDRLRPRAMVLATGALELWAPIPGWTLPGVYGLGGLQILLKTSGVVPRGPVVLAGAGPLLRLVAAQLLACGAEIAAVIDAAAPPTLGQLAGLAIQPRLLARGMRWELALRRHRVPILSRHAVVAIEGTQHAQAVEIAPVDDSWRPLPSGRRRIEAAVIGLGFGVRPNLELTRLAGCAHDHDPAGGGWHVSRSDTLETTIPGLFVAGDGAMIGGVDSALAEGALVAHAVAVRLGLPQAAALATGAAAARRRLSGLARFRAALNGWSMPRPGMFAAATADTLICRCEDVTRGQIADAVAAGYTEIGPLKMSTRAGMGLCQGRSCTPAIQHTLAALTGLPIEQIGLPTSRIPIRPVPLGAMAKLVSDRITP
jgi:NADPH-dependent 2,4-dienoyl-CoA reductase/sulfur reductase-like enzyme